MPEITSPEGLGVYIHFPWCLKKCPYCDFLSVAVPKSEAGETATASQARSWLPHEKYADAVINEWHARLQELSRPLPRLKSIFFGGGTPSLWRPQSLGRVLIEILNSYPGERDEELEISVECNPTSLDPESARALKLVGVNRLSVGVQNLHAERLEFLGRLHSPGGGLQAVRDALSANLNRVSADLIFGIYSQSPEDAKRDVAAVAATGVGHLSAYCLTIEANTRFGALHAKGKLPLIDDALAAESFEAVSQHLETQGLRHYEISNFARPGNESVHNLGYWFGRDYLGLGTGAFGTITTNSGRIRYRNFLSPERTMKLWGAESLLKPGTGESSLSPQYIGEREEISPEIANQESFLLGLRTVYGVDLEEMSSRNGTSPLGGRQKILDRLLSDGRLQEVGRRLSIPRQHWLWADGIIRDLL